MLPPIIAPPGRSSVQVTQARSRMSGPRFMRRQSASSCGRHERQPARRRRTLTKGSKTTDKDFSSENAIKFRLRVCDKQRGRIRRVCPFFSFFSSRGDCCLSSPRELRPVSMPSAPRTKLLFATERRTAQGGNSSPWGQHGRFLCCNHGKTEYYFSWEKEICLLAD